MEDFIAKVAEMRRLQKEYFKGSRDKYTLMACKKVESEVDTFLQAGKVTAKVPIADALQPSLF